MDVGSVFKFNTSTDLLTITNNQNTGGINLSGGNSRIYFGGYRAIEGDQSGGTLYLGEGYGTISLMDDTIVTGNVGIGTTSPSEELHVSGNARIGNNTTNGHLIGRKDYSLDHNFSTGLTVELGNHKACHVKVFISGDWSNHSSIAYVGEFFIQNTGNVGSYNEPGIILTEHDNLPSDQIESKIVDGTSDSFEIQFKTSTQVSSTIGARLCYHVMGDATSVS